MALIPPDEERGRRYLAEPDNPVDLPSGVVPPSAQLALSRATPEVGEPFELKVEIHWDGHLRDYLLHPPQVHLPPGIAQAGVESSSSSRLGSQVVTYTVRLRAQEAGAFSLDPVELRYTPHLEGRPVATRVSGPTVKVVAATLLGVGRPWFFLALGGLLAVCLLIGALVRRRLSGATDAREDHSPEARWKAALKQAHAQRVAGDVAGFLESAARLLEALQGLDEPQERDFEQLVERVRYGGERPSDSELDRLERRLERTVGERWPNKKEEQIHGGR